MGQLDAFSGLCTSIVTLDLQVATSPPIGDGEGEESAPITAYREGQVHIFLSFWFKGNRGRGTKAVQGRKKFLRTHFEWRVLEGNKLRVEGG